MGLFTRHERKLKRMSRGPIELWDASAQSLSPNSDWEIKLKGRLLASTFDFVFKGFSEVITTYDMIFDIHVREAERLKVPRDRDDFFPIFRAAGFGHDPVEPGNAMAAAVERILKQQVPAVDPLEVILIASEYANVVDELVHHLAKTIIESDYKALNSADLRIEMSDLTADLTSTFAPVMASLTLQASNGEIDASKVGRAMTDEH